MRTRRNNTAARMHAQAKSRGCHISGQGPEEKICPVMSANEDRGGAVTLHLAATWELRGGYEGGYKGWTVCECSDNELGR